MLDLHLLKPVQAMAASAFFKHKHLLLMLPRQEGKTELGCRLMHSLLSEGETRAGIFLAKSKEAGKKATREKFMRLFDDTQFQVNTAQVFNRACPTAVCYMDSVDKMPDKLRGGSYHLVHWSEVAFSEFQLGVTVDHVWDRILKPTQRATDGYSFIESTPNGHNGWYELWETAADKGFARLRISLSMLVDMGLVSREEYDALKKSMPDLVFRQEYECEFVTFSGRTYEEMRPHHIWADMPPPEEWQIVTIAIDWGWNPSATCVLFAYRLEGRICVFDEIYGREMLTSDIADEIKRRQAIWQMDRLAGCGDHDPKSIEELNLAGIQVGLAKKTDVLGNRLQIKTLFKRDELYIHPRCKNLLKDLDAAVWDDKPGKRGEIKESLCTWGHFDGEAALRYLVREFGGFELIKPRQNPHAYDSLSTSEFAMQQLIKG